MVPLGGWLTPIKCRPGVLLQAGTRASTGDRAQAGPTAFSRVAGCHPGRLLLRELGLSCRQPAMQSYLAELQPKRSRAGSTAIRESNSYTLSLAGCRCAPAKRNMNWRQATPSTLIPMYCMATAENRAGANEALVVTLGLPEWSPRTVPLNIQRSTGPPDNRTSSGWV